MHWLSYFGTLGASLRSALGPQPSPRPLPIPAGPARIPAQRDRRATAAS